MLLRASCELSSLHRVREGVADIRELLAGKHSNSAIVRQELARHIDTITLLRDGKVDTVTQKGKWKLLGAGLGYRDGAGRANLTVLRLPVPFEIHFEIPLMGWSGAIRIARACGLAAR